MLQALFALSVLFAVVWCLYVIYRLKLFGADYDKDMAVMKHNLRQDLGVETLEWTSLVCSWRLWAAVGLVCFAAVCLAR